MTLDPDAKSANPELPAFLAPPADAPVYHGFRVLEDVQVDGFIFGSITDFENASADEGDAFVIAPDGSRAGIVWHISKKEYFRQALPITRNRWGVWSVSFEGPMRNREDARRNLKRILPKLKKKWAIYKKRFRRGR